MRAEPKVIYLRWVASPSTGDVSISHNHEGHPANIRFHDGLAEDRPEHDLVGGYAYRAIGGWKLTDLDHKPLKEPHTRRIVLDSIKRTEAQ